MNAICCFLALTVITQSAYTEEFKSFGTYDDPYANLTSVDDLINVLIRKDCMKVHCLGRGCEPVTEKGGCQICLCPTGTPGRGCDKMPPFMQGDLFWRGCPNDTDESARTITRYPAKLVQRWYRAIDRKLGIDECRNYPFPLCESDLDYNLWSSPRTIEECKDYCYVKAEPTTTESTTARSTLSTISADSTDTTLPSTVSTDTTLPTTVSSDTTLPTTVSSDTTTVSSTVSADTTVPSTVSSSDSTTVSTSDTTTKVIANELINLNL